MVSSVVIGCAVDYLGICANDSILVIVPLFHANAWGIPYSAAMSGAKLVFPGPHTDGKSVYELLRDEKVTFSCGVPTVWTMFFDHIDRHAPGAKLPAFNRVVCGGSAMPRSMIQRFINELDTQVLQIWGMTEMSPMGTLGSLLPRHRTLPWYSTPSSSHTYTHTHTHSTHFSSIASACQ
jgi:fatty-acyl-CoA synthase